MRNDRSKCIGKCSVLLAGVCLLLVDWLVPADAQTPDPVEQAPRPHVDVAAAPDGALSLEFLLALASENNPDLAVARARAEAARGRMVQAGLYPNPTLNWEADEVGNRANAAGTQGPFVVQPIVTAHKLRIATAAAAQGVVAADWQSITRWFDVVTRVRLAYFELLTAQQEVRTNEEVVRIAEEGLQVAQKLEKAGAGTQPDVLRAQVELNQNQVQLGVSRRRLEAAWKLLATAVGVPALPGNFVLGSLEVAPPLYDWQPVLETVLSRSSEVQEVQSLVLQAEQLLKRAEAEVCPNLLLLVRPFYAFPDQTTQLKVEVGAALPIFDRNQGNIRAARADLARIREEVRQVELRLTDRLTNAFQRYLAASQQVRAYEKDILPSARESLRLVRLGYEKGDAKYDYTAVLQAQHILVQVRLTYVQALGNLWRAVSEIAGLLQQEDCTFGFPAAGHENEPDQIMQPSVASPDSPPE